MKFGAPEVILYNAKPHIGTDNLRKIVKNIREYIISKGGQVFFNEQVTDFEIEDKKIKAVKCSKRIETDVVILAIGHSARDTFKKIYELGVEVQPKNFAIGVRIEHLLIKHYLHFYHFSQNYSFHLLLLNFVPNLKP